MLSHLLGSIFGLILAIFGTFALGAYLTTSSAGRLGLVAMVITVLGSALFLPAVGVSAFAAPEEGQAYLAGIEEFSELPPHLRRYRIRGDYRLPEHPADGARGRLADSDRRGVDSLERVAPTFRRGIAR